MGVNLRGLFPQRPVPEGWYAGKTIAVDGHNVAFRYLTAIRGRDGDVLRNAEGRATGHLLGFMGLVRRFRSLGAEPLVVWDGEVHPRKRATVDERVRRRGVALAAALEAKARGDHAEHARLMRSTVHLDASMLEDASRLLAAVGVGVVRADHDGERYAAALCRAGHADAVASEDFDALVAGAPSVLRKAGGEAPFLLHLRDLDAHGLSEAQLRQVAILCGTDWHPGIKGFGAKTAVKAVKAFPDLGRLFEEAAGGAGATRFHRMVRGGGLTWEEFEDLEGFIRDLPSPARPRPPRPSPEAAVALAEEFRVGRERALGCFC